MCIGIYDIDVRMKDLHGCLCTGLKIFPGLKAQRVEHPGRPVRLFPRKKAVLPTMQKPRHLNNGRSSMLLALISIFFEIVGSTRNSYKDVRSSSTKQLLHVHLPL